MGVLLYVVNIHPVYSVEVCITRRSKQGVY